MAINDSYLAGYHSNMIFIEVYQNKYSLWRSCQDIFFAQVLVAEIYPGVAGKREKYKRGKPETQGE